MESPSAPSQSGVSCAAGRSHRRSPLAGRGGAPRHCHHGAGGQRQARAASAKPRSRTSNREVGGEMALRPAASPTAPMAVSGSASAARHESAQMTEPNRRSDRIPHLKRMARPEGPGVRPQASGPRRQGGGCGHTRLTARGGWAMARNANEQRKMVAPNAAAAPRTTGKPPCPCSRAISGTANPLVV